MSKGLAFRLAAVGFAALAILLAVLQTRRPISVQRAVRPPTSVAPIDARLARCQALGAAGAQDPECLKAWAESRTRFLSRPSKPAAER